MYMYIVACITLSARIEGYHLHVYSGTFLVVKDLCTQFCVKNFLCMLWEHHGRVPAAVVWKRLPYLPGRVGILSCNQRRASV